MIRWLAVGAAVCLALVFATPGVAQRPEPLTKLWSEYPLLPEVEATGSPSIGPFLPPSDPEVAPASGDSMRWSVWLAAIAAGLIGVFVAVRTVRPAAAFGSRAHERTAGRLRARPAPRALVSTPLSQYAPPTLETPDPEDELRRFVIRRTGLVRSRFVVYADEAGGELSVQASSRSFWHLGGAAWRERLAEDAWDDLMNDLRMSGWEQESARRSDFYVSLRRIEDGSSAVVPTIEAYLYTTEDQEQE